MVEQSAGSCKTRSGGRAPSARVRRSCSCDRQPDRLFRCNVGDVVALVANSRLFTAQPVLQAIKIEVDDGRRVERKQLTQREAADHGIAEGLAQLRADS